METTFTKSEETRKRLVRTAVELFIAKGFEQATMREIAEKAGMAVGGFYYYFKNKEEIVLEFYIETQKQMAEKCDEICQKKSPLKTKVLEVLQYKFDQLTPYRTFFGALAKTATDPKNSLSPFSSETRQVREDAVLIFEKVFQSSEVGVSKELRPHLPYLFWLYQLGLVFFWINDNSENQKKTKMLMEGSLEVIFRLMKLSQLPIMRSLKKGMSNLISQLLTP